MAIFKKQFADADSYEEWLEKASGRVNVLEIKNAPKIFGSSLQPSNGPVIVRYQTNDKSFGPAVAAWRRRTSRPRSSRRVSSRCRST